jgi:hypothetical protein
MTYAVQASTSGNDCVITLPAVENQYYVLEQIIYSYSGTIGLGSGGFKIEFEDVKILDFDIKADILGSILDLVANAYQSPVNEEVNLTLKGVTGLIGKLSIIYQVYTS